MRTPLGRRAGLLSEPGRGFCQYLPLFTQYPVLTAQPIEFLTFARGQTVAAQTFIECRLLDPLSDGLGAGLELARQLAGAAAGIALTPPFAAGIPAHMVDGLMAFGFSLSLLPQLRRNALFYQLLQTLIELAPAANEERSLLESISNHISAKPLVAEDRQREMFRSKEA
jgi:hypothetical protein